MNTMQPWEIIALLWACIGILAIVIIRIMRDRDNHHQAQDVDNIPERERAQLLRDLQYYKSRLDRLLDLQASIEEDYQEASGRKDNQRILKKLLTLDNQIHATNVKLNKINERLDF